MKKNEIIEYIVSLVVVCAISFFVFILLLHTPLFRSMKVYMYRGIALIIISTIISIFLMIFAKKYVFKTLAIKDIISVPVVFITVTMMFFTLVPVTVERSVSVHMLFSIEKNDGMTKEDIEKNFIDNYVIKNDAFNKRIVEQDATYTIELGSDNKYRLTDRGKFLVDMFKFIGNIFAADMKLMEE